VQAPAARTEAFGSWRGVVLAVPHDRVPGLGTHRRFTDHVGRGQPPVGELAGTRKRGLNRILPVRAGQGSHGDVLVSINTDGTGAAVDRAPAIVVDARRLSVHQRHCGDIGARTGNGSGPEPLAQVARKRAATYLSAGRRATDRLRA
jgi:hypothetical protein